MCALLLPSFSSCLQPPLSLPLSLSLLLSLLSLLLLSVCLTAVVGFRIALFLFSSLFYFFFGIQYIYTSDVRNKGNLYIPYFFLSFPRVKKFRPFLYLFLSSFPLHPLIHLPALYLTFWVLLPASVPPLRLDVPLCLRFPLTAVQNVSEEVKCTMIAYVYCKFYLMLFLFVFKNIKSGEKKPCQNICGSLFDLHTHRIKKYRAPHTALFTVVLDESNWTNLDQRLKIDSALLLKCV